ncbi:MAG: hypothetical protein ACKO6B_16315 [Planctomycetia bacterium]
MSQLSHAVREVAGRIHNRIVTARRPDRILVIHIAKTAGTSLRRMLEDEYGSRQVYPGDFYLRKTRDGLYPLGSEMLRDYAKAPPHNVLVGHFTAAMADLLPTPYQAVTFLRDPIQRSLSLLGHKARTEGLQVSRLVEDPDFLAAHIADHQTRILGADGVCDPHQVKTVDDDVLERAIGRVQSLAFVGITERFAESCRIFDARFRTRIAESIRREAVLRPEGGELAEHIPRIEPLVRRDRILYDRAVARLTADLAAVTAGGA